MELATDASGNTRPSAKARNWLLTLNQVDKYEELCNYLKNLKSLTYFISSNEVGKETGHEHIHIYCQFNTPIKLSLRKTCGAHLDACRGTPQQCRDYVVKDGNIIEEIGSMRKWGGLPSIAECKTATDEELDSLSINYFNVVQKIKEHRKGERYFKPPNVEWHYGPTGTGKTRKAFEAGAENVIYHNGFFSDWGDAKIISIEEMRGQIPFDELLRLTDGYHNYYKVNIKGGSKYVDLDGIFISSPKRPEECYPHQRDNDCIDQLLRRITTIEEHFIEKQ